MLEAILYTMAGFGRFKLYIDSGNFLRVRSCLGKFYQNALKYTTKENELPPKPKRPVSCFIMYLNSVRSKLKEENPDLKAIHLAQKASQAWAQLNPNYKEHLRNEYIQNYETYVVKVKEYENSLTEEQKKLLKESKTRYKLANRGLDVKEKLKTFQKPKRPMTSFFIYVKSKQNERKPNITQRVWMKDVAEQWYAMSDIERAKYNTEASGLKKQYNQELLKWEKEMIELGHLDIVRVETGGTKVKH
ncbi:PREDICTED: transcription factor A, mitochondrial-like [Dufourea novaeangliae]|uniref:Transcription factor A, mitochondrial n=1 Tax=Dufourea novaeangliae TaxID=178035 RepID=A0A154P7L0_DUFNO|nr:PREDICTED: transcription factor A, mitochondrial-like [Dufourea novaeangliae]KZC07841.1 Transcription factor A, mitochondrial [Dufourea novaeangliae]